MMNLKEARMRQRIYLTGFMGCGKTTVGSSLAAAQGKKFVDLDDQIEKKENTTIAHIFDIYGEAYFRMQETKLLYETKALHHAIISMGGGIVEEEMNRRFLKDQYVIYLKWDFEVLYKRIQNDDKRPLVTTKEALYSRYCKRALWYEEVADATIDCTGHTPFTLTQLLLQKI